MRALRKYWDKPQRARTLALLGVLVIACDAPAPREMGNSSLGGGRAGAGGSGSGGSSGIESVAAAGAGARGGEGGAGSQGTAGRAAVGGAAGSVAGAGSDSSGGGSPAAGGRAAAGSGGAAGGAPSIGGIGGAAGSGGTGGLPDDDRCSVAVHDPANPPVMLTLTGNLGTHDPALIEVDGTFYLYATGNGLGAKTSMDLESWQGAPAVFDTNPAWIEDQVPAATNLWAPDIAYFGGQYHLYYSASSFASNRSCIGHATRAALDTGSFTDHGSIFCSNVTTSGDDFNAIDPNVVLDQEGTPWLSFGSFWSGIKQFELASDGTRAGDDLIALADRPQNSGALEGPFIVRRCGYYYLFVSWGACCDEPWDYELRVGRSTSINGPFTDKTGEDMLDGGGTLLFRGTGSITAPGHNAVIFVGMRAYNVYHALDSSHQNPVLRVAELMWDDEGWPISAGP
jgi:arabinan endo-1,5-alpha-L-arabinosidase